MKTLSAFLFASLALASLAFGETADQQDRVAASFILALGRIPTSAELAQWSQGTGSVADLVAKHQQQLKADAAARKAVVAKSFQDAFGRAATDAELGAASSDQSMYTELMKRHIATLAKNADEYAKVLDRAYQLVIRRSVYIEEIDYWKKRDALSFALLVGAVEDWARRNQPGLMVTAGNPTISVNSEFLATVRLSPALADEARQAVGLPAAKAKSGYNIVAAGADKILSSGGIHFAATGGENLATGAAK
jgi:hypothetical protein